MYGGGGAYFNNSKITSLGKLESIGGNAHFSGSEVTDLGELERIGRGAYFNNSKITSLGELESIGGNAHFSDSEVTDLGNLRTIGGGADFRRSKITSLGKLERIGRGTYFSDSKVTDLGRLESIPDVTIFYGRDDLREEWERRKSGERMREDPGTSAVNGRFNAELRRRMDGTLPADRSEGVETDDITEMTENFENPSPAPMESTSLPDKRAAAERTARSLGVEVDIVDRDGMPEGARTAQGFYRDGRVAVCPANCRDAAEAAATVLHEAVGHKGLRRLVGERNMLGFCMDVYAKAGKAMREEIVSLARSRGWNVAKAVEEHLARLAERMDFGADERSFLRKVADALRGLLRSIGIAIPIGTADARWILWQSYHANRQTDLVVKARRTVLAHRLGMDIGSRAAVAEARGDVRLRDAGAELQRSAAEVYNSEVMSNWGILRETYQDNMRSLDILQKAIAGQTGKEVRPYEDAVMAANRASSITCDADKQYRVKFIEPMMEAVEALLKETGSELEDIKDYVMLKHGLERNVVLAKRDARKVYEERHRDKVRTIKADGLLTEEERRERLDKADAELSGRLADIEAGTDRVYLRKRGRDYSGMTGFFADAPAKADGSKPAVEELEAMARRIVDGVEEASRSGCETLWERINAATKETLRFQFEHGMLGREQYDHLRGMFKHYVPLRGFAETTGEDVYMYYTQTDSRFTPPVHNARGRRSRPESPFGWIGAAASSAIAQGVKNDTKLRLYYLVTNRPDQDLATLAKVWYRRRSATSDEWEPRYPEIDEGMTPEQVRESIGRFNKEMEENEAIGMAVRRRNELRAGARVVKPSHAREHLVSVKVLGEESVIVVNGNPRAAQAINGELNINASGDVVWQFGASVTRFLAQMCTGANPEFWLSNAQRDILFSLLNVGAKEGGDYSRAFRGNLVRARAVLRLAQQHRKGRLEDSWIGGMYREFVEGGGVTGYSNVVNNAEYERELDRYVKEADARVRKGIRNVWEWYKTAGESIEQLTRFATYLTSREAGRTVERSVYDAKEVTVNFNRKGSGQAISWEDSAKLRTRDGRPANPAQRAAVFILSAMSPLVRNVYMFFNATIQATRSVAVMAAGNPRRTGAYAGAFFALGLLNAALHGMLGDDDYLDTTDFDRRNNALLGWDGAYFKWALPQEARPFYALADIAYAKAAGRSPHKRFVPEVVESFLEVTPFNPASEGAMTFVPSAVRPLVEAGTNKDYRGAPVYRKTGYLTDEERASLPRYTLAFDDAFPPLVWLSKTLSDLSGGDYAEGGLVNFNPAAVQHVLEGYGSGTLRAAEKTVSAVIGAFGGRFSVRDTPFLSRLVTVNDERYRNAHTTEVYKYYEAVAERTRSRMRKYLERGDGGRLSETYLSDDRAVMEVVARHSKQMRTYDALIKDETDRDARRRLMREQDALREMVIGEISDALERSGGKDRP